MASRQTNKRPRECDDGLVACLKEMVGEMKKMNGALNGIQSECSSMGAMLCQHGEYTKQIVESLDSIADRSRGWEDSDLLGKLDSIADGMPDVVGCISDAKYNDTDLLWKLEKICDAIERGVEGRKASANGSGAKPKAKAEAK
jgi:hypothetical protein